MWKFVEVHNSDCLSFAVMSNGLEGGWRLYSRNRRRRCLVLEHYSGLRVIVRAGRVHLWFRSRALFFPRKP